MQPTFALDVPHDPELVTRALRSAIGSPELREHAVAAGRCVDFKIAESQRRFWSPHLSVQVYDVDDGSGCQVYGRFAPRPEVWTMFMFVYFIAAMVAFAGGIYGYVQWVLGQTPWAMALLPAGLAAIVLLHVASLIGQGLSSDQMELLRTRFDHAYELASTSLQSTPAVEDASALS